MTEHPPVDGMDMLPGTFCSAEEGRRRILEKDYPELVDTAPEG